MLKRISAWLYRVSTGWVALSALAVFLLFTALVLPGQASRAAETSGDAPSPDTSFLYSAAELYRMAEDYGEEGRRAYVRARFTFDLVWPAVYTVFLATAMSWVYGHAFSPGSRWRLANLAPLTGALLDLAENVSTSLVMARYPARTAVVDVLAPAFTLSKWIFVYGSFALLLMGIAVAAWRWARAKVRP